MALIGFVSAKRLQGSLAGKVYTGEIGICVERNYRTKRRILKFGVLDTGEFLEIPLRRQPRMPKSVGIPTV